MLILRIGVRRNKAGAVEGARDLLLHGAEGEGAEGVYDDEVDGDEYVCASEGELVQVGTWSLPSSKSITTSS